MELLSRIARRSDEYRSYRMARRQLRDVKNEPIMLGLTHNDEMLPLAKKMVKLLRSRGRSRFGIELPENYVEESLRMEFFSPLAEYAQKLGYDIIPLLVALRDDEFNAKREGSGKVLDILSINTWNMARALLHIKHELREVVARLTIVERVKIGGVAALAYMPPENIAGIFGDLKARNLSSLSISDVALVEAGLLRWCSSLEYAKYLVENKTTDEIKEIFRLANEELDRHIISAIRREKPDLIVIGDGHARSINPEIGYVYIQMTISNLTWSM